jgi:hypothetical protein
MSYTNTLILVAADCPVDKSEIPVIKTKSKPAHVFQYELLTQSPYAYDHEELIYQVYVQQKEIPAAVLATDAEKIKQELFSKGHPCLRASSLTKRYGWGAHYNQEGKIAIYPMESAEYKRLADSGDVKIIPAMQRKRETKQ